MEEIRVRFAPSPTGPLHIGGARSALFNFLYAKASGGKFILRVEDTDLERSSRESEKNILESLKWLGIDWDEGPDKGGPHAPYRQTERLSSYQKFAQELIDKGMAYYCFCSEQELEAQRQEFQARGELPRYSGKCSCLTEQEIEQYRLQGLKPVVRFKVPENQEIVVDDLVRGHVSFDSNGIGDFVILKSDGIPTYNFAVVIDDYLMKISHVVRAEEHLSNTPRQILIYNAFQWELPRFAHISLILGEDRSKMSKRHGATSVVQYRELGYLPEAIVNFLALLGWSPEGEQERFTLDELIQEFSLNRVAKNPAIFDMDKLRWLNGVYIRETPLEELTDLAIPFLIKGGYLSPDPGPKEVEWARLVIAALQDRLAVFGEIGDYMSILMGEDVTLENQEAGQILQEDTFPLVIRTFLNKASELGELSPDNVKALLKSLTKELKLGGKQVYMPVRIALTGQMHGPELFYIIPILGLELIRKRIANTAGQAGVTI